MKILTVVLIGLSAFQFVNAQTSEQLPVGTGDEYVTSLIEPVADSDVSIRSVLNVR